MAKSNSRMNKKMADALNHRRQIWWLKHGFVMIPTLSDEIKMRKAVAAARKAEA